MLGGTREVNDKLVYRGSYMLIGRKGMVEGTAVELVAPANQIISYALQFVNGVPVGIGNTPTAMPSQFASASALSTLDTKVTSIDGRVSTQAEQLLVLTSDNDANKNALSVQGRVIDGVKSSYMVKMETNGVIGGFGLMQSTGELGQVVTTFGVNADAFFIGAPVGGKKPFMVLTSSQTIDGITYPAGTWINTAIIANATIGSAHIADASITNAKIGDAQITSAKIADLDASKITAGTIDAARIGVGSITADKIQVGSLSAISADLGTIKVGSANIANLAVNAAHIANAAITSAKIGDLEVDSIKIRDNAVSTNIAVSGASSVTITTASSSRLTISVGITTDFVATENGYNTQLRLFRNGTAIKTFDFKHTSMVIDGGGSPRYSYVFTCALPSVIDIVAQGTYVYSVQVLTPQDYSTSRVWGTPATNTWVKLSNLTLGVMELKK